MQPLHDNLNSIEKYDVLVFTRLVHGDRQFVKRTELRRAIIGGVGPSARGVLELRLHVGEALHYVVRETEPIVYRITVTTHDGYDFELPWTQVKGRCAELGVQHVPELHRQRHYCGDGPALLQMLEPMLDDGSMVVRVEKGLQTRFFSHFRTEDRVHRAFIRPCIGTSMGMM